MTLAKSLCGGIAGGAMIARRAIAPSLRAGMHASTFGGNPIAAAAGIATLETIEADGLLAQAKANTARFAERLGELAEQCPHIREVRQAGLMIGVELDFDGSEVVTACLDRGLLVNCTHSTVLRLLPAMNISAEQIDRGISILADALTERISAITQPESLAPNT